MRYNRLHIKQIVSFILFCGVAFGVFNIITPVLFRILPNDYARTKLILNQLKHSSDMDLVILGNSRGMSGINGYILEEKLANHPHVYNLSSSSQTFAQSVLYYHSLPDSTKIVLQCIDVDRAFSPLSISEANKLSLIFYGYSFDEETKKWLPQLVDDLSPSIINNWKARDILFTSLVYYMRQLLDDDVPEKSILEEIKFPSSQTSLRSAAYDYDVDLQNKENRFSECSHVSEDWKSLLNTSYLYFKSRNIHYYLVLMPYNSDIAFNKTKKQKAVNIFKDEFSNIPMIDCIDLLSPEDFYDAIHPNNNGAKIITDKIITSLP